ncbi:MAG TPA: hypothetical protein VER79_10200 [Candidatus Limnocylindrales bacterium]|nr:hypothetical protein [Candidatus Limnocylindrales bacterium]
MIKRLLCLMVVLLGVSISLVHAQEGEHPRLWVTAEDLPRLQSWATEDNPVWVQLQAMADEAVSAMDSGAIERGDLGGAAWEEYPHENYAMLLAFLSLAHPDAAVRADYASRARTLLMTVIDQAVLGPAEGVPFRDPAFALSDRSRWYGEGFPLTVDWIYSTLSAQDKAAIQTVFARWCDENRTAGTTNNNHPEPLGVVNDPALTADRTYARWSGNNYYAAHMRNMGLMGMALDAADDPSGVLATCLNEATGAWLYVLDDQMRTDMAGGMSAEGYEYGPQTFGYTAQLLLALQTAGEADMNTLGPQVAFASNPFWDDAIKAYFHSLSPAPVQHDWFGSVYQPAWYGSGQNYYMPDHIAMFAPLGILDAQGGNSARLNAIRWLQLNTAPGGAEGLADRAGFEQFSHGLLYYLLFDPTAAPPTDPRSSLNTVYYAPGMRRLLARTDWVDDAAWFTYSNSWNTVDHQAANANAIEFYRAGEWLTKVRVGYDLDYISSPNLNTVAIQNTPPEHDDWRGMLGERGSQWLYVASGDPLPPRMTVGEGFVSAYGDATNAYNSEYEGSTSVTHASRSVVWLMPDVIVVYDQIATAMPGFKRFWLNLPASAAIDGQTATMVSPGGQTFTIQTLLPDDATLSVTELTDEPSGAPAEGETMRWRFGAEAAGDPARTTFLHVLVGGDSAPEVELLSSDERGASVRVGEDVIMFSGEVITVNGRDA